MDTISQVAVGTLPDGEALEQHGLKSSAASQILEIAMSRRQISTGEMARLLDPRTLLDRSKFTIAIAWLAGFLKGMNIAIVTGKQEVDYKQKFPVVKKPPQPFQFKKSGVIEEEEVPAKEVELLEYNSEQKRDFRAFGLDPAFEWYMRKIKHPLLTQQEEISLGEKMVAGDINARNKLVRHNLRLVISIARHFLWSGWELLDLIEEGNLGLITAANKFDYRRGNKFSTMATWWIKQQIHRSIMNTSNEIRMPVYIQDARYTILKISHELEQELDRVPTKEEIAKKMGKPEKFVTMVLENSGISIVSLHSSKESGEGGTIGRHRG